MSSANIVLENTTFDIPSLFGAGSPEDLERKQSPALAQTDFVGIAVHCARKDASCAATQPAAHEHERGRPEHEPNSGAVSPTSPPCPAARFLDQRFGILSGLGRDGWWGCDHRHGRGA